MILIRESGLLVLKGPMTFGYKYALETPGNSFGIAVSATEKDARIIVDRELRTDLTVTANGQRCTGVLQLTGFEFDRRYKVIEHQIPCGKGDRYVLEVAFL